jgi:hypothetical protein
MAQNVIATNLQKLEYDVTTAEGPSHVTIVSGLMRVALDGNPSADQQGSFETLLDPTLAPGKFRKATAVASISSWSFQTPLLGQNPPQNAPQEQYGFSIDQIEATLNEESGQIQLRVDATVKAVTAANTRAFLNGIAFQVTTLSIQ